MQRFKTFTLAVLMTLPLSAQVAQRQVEQQRRIGAGAATGSLTPKETGRLERQEGRIHREIKRDRVDGGGFSPAERAKANRKLNRESNKIYRQKHDAERRP